MFTSCRFVTIKVHQRVDTGQVGRPKFDIKEETLVELRSLGFSWEVISRMLLVSRWIILIGLCYLTITPVRHLAKRQIYLSPDSLVRDGPARIQFVDTNFELLTRILSR